jgi:hypothetical protein
MKRGESNIPNLFVKLEVGLLDGPLVNHRGALAHRLRLLRVVVITGH